MKGKETQKRINTAIDIIDPECLGLTEVLSRLCHSAQEEFPEGRTYFSIMRDMVRAQIVDMLNARLEGACNILSELTKE